MGGNFGGWGGVGRTDGGLGGVGRQLVPGTAVDWGTGMQ